MGSFYGNGTSGSINNSALSFDLIYHNRAAMEENAQKDSVFLGRYVLVDYEQPPITLYFSEASGSVKAYRDKELTLQVAIKDCATNALYINGLGSSPHLFYVISGGGFIPASTDAISQYQANYSLDNRYGRSYDSTVWMKTYDSNVVYDEGRKEYREPLEGEVAGAYRYVMIAELNSVTPEFHLMVEQPTEVPTTPYFDRDTTKLNYYLHLSPAFGSRVRTATTKGNVNGTEVLLSDAQVTYDKVNYTPETPPGYNTEEVTVNGDIYFNKRGFNRVQHAMSPVDGSGNRLLNDTINYDLVESGRLYRDQQSPDLTDTKTAKDTYEWFINLPSLGDSICQMWDLIYGYHPTEHYRYVQLAKQRADDRASDLDANTYACGVSYNDETVIGMLNTLRDLKGYNDVLTVGNFGGDNAANVKKLYGLEPATINGVKVPTKYGCFVPDAVYEATRDYNPNEEYYLKTGSDNEGNDLFEKANGALIDAKDAAGNYIIPRESGTTYPDQWFYKKVAGTSYRQVVLEEPVDDTLYGWFVRVHQLLGTGLPESRNSNTVIGALNKMNDLFQNFDMNLAPGRILVTNPATGRIEASKTYFPHSAGSSGYVLSQEGDWVCRLKNFTVGAANTAVVPNASSVVNLTADETWINLTPSASKIHWSHAVVNSVDYTPTVVTSSAIDLTQGGSISLFSAGSIDKAGHVVSPSNTVIYLPKLTFSTAGTKTLNTANDGKMLVGASVTTKTENNISTTNIDWQWGYVSEQKLVNYVLGSDDGVLAVSDSVNSAFSKLEKRHNNLVTTVADNKTAIEKTVADNKAAIEKTVADNKAAIEQTVADNKTAIEKTVQDLDTKVNDNKTAADQTHQDLADAISALTAEAGPVTALEGRVSALDSTDENSLGLVQVNKNDIATINTALYGEDGTAAEPAEGSLAGAIKTNTDNIGTLNTALENVTTLGAQYVLIYDTTTMVLKMINAITGEEMPTETVCQWYQNDVAVAEVITPSYNISTKADGIAYNYRCQYTIGNYTFGSGVLTITIPVPEV